MTKIKKSILVFLFLILGAFLSAQTITPPAPTAPADTSTITLSAAQLQSIVQDEITTAVNQAVAIAVREKENQINTLTSEVQLGATQIQALQTQYNNLVTRSRTDLTLGVIVSAILGTGVGIVIGILIH
jgi:seryl-tRNA(Sec) selenium transferase